jgi:hypothetical protein
VKVRRPLGVEVSKGRFLERPSDWMRVGNFQSCRRVMNICSRCRRKTLLVALEECSDLRKLEWKYALEGL